MALIQTDEIAARMRAKIIRLDTGEILISRLDGSAQENDLTVPVNCGGLGRVRHFRRATPAGWPQNFLPIDPAIEALGLGQTDMIEAQVFQNAACAWRCWYCFVPFELLGGDERRSEWITASQLVERYASLEDRPPILDLSGGSPDLTPEWIPWTIEALERQGISDTTYLWSDDNLSTDLVFDALNDAQRQLLCRPNYGRVCCFKGFDAESFSFNTGAGSTGFDLQFERFARYLDLGIDLYAYVTFTGPTFKGLEEKMIKFVERLRSLNPNLPARTVPLRIESFGPVAHRNHNKDLSVPLNVQEKAVEFWRLLTCAPAAA